MMVSLWEELTSLLDHLVEEVFQLLLFVLIVFCSWVA